MTLPDEAVEQTPRQLISLPDYQFERFVSNHLSTVNYAVPSVDTDKKVRAAKDRPFFTNNGVWEAILFEHLRRTDIKVVLDGFFIFEWLPRSPGLFFTPEGRRARTEAQNHIESIQNDLIVYNPYGKASMLDGGVGNIRLKPIQIGRTSYCFMSASSSGICHEGFPVALPEEYRNECIDEIAERGAVVRKLVGRLKFVPEDLVSLYRGYAGVPQLYLEVQEVLPADHPQSRHMQDLRVSVAVSFSSSFEGDRRIYAAYVSFDPSEPGSLHQNVKWMEQQYVIGKYQGKVITDFDQQKANFAAATFSLDKVMSRTLIADEVRPVAKDLGLDTEEILKHQSQVTISIGEYYAGGKYNVTGGQVGVLGENQVININQANAKPEKPAPPDSLWQAIIHTIWPMRPLSRNLLLALAGIAFIGFSAWASLPDDTKIDILSRLSRIFNRGPSLTSEQSKDLQFNILMAETEEASNKPNEALYYYQKALAINPEDEKLQKKIEALKESIAKGASR